MHLLEQIECNVALRPVESLAARVHREHDILKHGEAGQQIETLEDHADVAAAVAVPVHLRQIVPLEQHLAAGGCGQSADERQQRGFAGA